MTVIVGLISFMVSFHSDDRLVDHRIADPIAAPHCPELEVGCVTERRIQLEGNRVATPKAPLHRTPVRHNEVYTPAPVFSQIQIERTRGRADRAAVEQLKLNVKRSRVRRL